MTETDNQYLKDAAILSYKVASRLFLALLTTLFLYVIYAYDAGFGNVTELRRQARDIGELASHAYRLSSRLPYGLLDTVDSAKVKEILSWNFEHAQQPEVQRGECDSAGCFINLFTPTETSLDIRIILGRFQQGLSILRRESVPDSADPRNLYMAWFIPLVNESDGQLLWKHGPRYEEPAERRTTDSITFNRINLCHKNVPDSKSPHEIYSEWSPLITRLDSLASRWPHLQNRITPRKDADSNQIEYSFTIRNIKQLSQSFYDEAIPPLPKFEFSSIRANARPALLTSGFIFLAIMSIIFWFLREATIFETKYVSSLTNNLTRPDLSALSSGVFYFFQSNARILKQNKKSFWPWVALLFNFIVFFAAPVLWDLFIFIYVTREDTTLLNVAYFVLTILTALLGSSLFSQAQRVNRWG